MRKIKLLLEYDGTDFCGWQYQPNLRTVQNEIQCSLKKIFSKEITIIGSGRTDTGVHAKGQVAHFTLDNDMPLHVIKSALNGTMPKDIRIISAEEVDLNFNSRYDAVKRHYCYTITQREIAINRNYAWCYKQLLDLEKIQTASDFLLGEHDFRAFCQAGADVKHHRCILEKILWEKADHIITLNIAANRFLHNMVRIIVGTMINVGREFTAVDEIPVILESLDRGNAGPTAPAKGLCLEKVYY